MGVENRDDPHVVAGLQVALDDLTSLTGGFTAPVLRLHSDKAKEFLAVGVRKLLRAHGIRQTTNSGYDPAANGIAERWVGIIKVRPLRFWQNIGFHQTIGHTPASGLPMCTIIES